MKKIIAFAFIFICGATLYAQKSKNKKESKNMVTEIIISTSYGEMKAILYNETPQHRDNFIKLINDGFYDGTLFHRIIKLFMIQGGDPDSKHAEPGQRLGSGDVGYMIPAEILPDKIHKKGALSAARQDDMRNPTRASSGCQFYIVQGQAYSQAQLDMMQSRMKTQFTPQQIEAYTTVGGTPHLDGAYTVFGELTEGFDVLEKISEVQTDRNDRPVKDIPMTIKIVKK